MQWIARLLGLDSPASPYYLFWSGAGGVSLALGTALAIVLRWFNCDERGCWRRGRYQLPDSILVVCPRHWHAGQVAREESDGTTP